MLGVEEDLLPGEDGKKYKENGQDQGKGGFLSRLKKRKDGQRGFLEEFSNLVTNSPLKNMVMRRKQNNESDLQHRLDERERKRLMRIPVPPGERITWVQNKVPSSVDSGQTHKELCLEISHNFVSSLFENLWDRQSGAGYLALRQNSVIRIQCAERCRRSRKCAREMRAIGLKLKAESDARWLECKRQERQAKKEYRLICRDQAGRLLTLTIKHYLQPWAVVDMQRVWRGYRCRKRLARYLRRLAWLAQREKERRRYLEGLRIIQGRGLDDIHAEWVRRRVWGRGEFEHTGWHPHGILDVGNIQDYIWEPPASEQSGLRIQRVKLPVKSEWCRRIVTTDPNAWVGVPIPVPDMRQRPKTAQRIGPPPRPGTITAHGLDLPLPQTEGTIGKSYRTKFTWLPAPLVSKAPLLQQPLPAPSRTTTN